jgi:hypothetical protein
VHLGSDPSPGELIGRTRECRSLEALLEALRNGQSRVLVVRGDAGMGKSALLQHLVGRASGFTVVHVTGVESEMALPFAALHGVCGSMLDRVDALPDPQRDALRQVFGLAAGAPPDRLLTGLGVLSLISAVAEDRPLLCVIDDAHWLDHDSEQTLAFVARRLLAEHIALVFATRQPTPAIAPLPMLAVDGLHDADAHALLRSALHVPLDEPVRDRIVAETRGNPLALVEWLRRADATRAAGHRRDGTQAQRRHLRRAHPAGGAHRAPRRRGPHQPRDRRAALHQPAHGRMAPAQGLHQARHHVPPPTPRHLRACNGTGLSERRLREASGTLEEDDG